MSTKALRQRLIKLDEWGDAPRFAVIGRACETVEEWGQRYCDPEQRYRQPGIVVCAVRPSDWQAVVDELGLGDEQPA